MRPRFELPADDISATNIRHYRSAMVRCRAPSRAAAVALAIAALSHFACAQQPTPDDLQAAEETAGVAVTERGTVNLHVADLPLATVLRMLSIKGERNIIASPNVKGRVTANLYDVTFNEALRAILMTNDAGYRQLGGFIYVHTNKELEAIAAESSGRRVTRVYQLNYISAIDAKSYIAPVLDDGDSVAESPPTPTGLDTGGSDSGGNAHAAQDFLVVTARPTTLRQIEDILKEVDVRPRQVLIEATILRAELTDDNAMGIDFTLVGGVDLELLGASSNGIASLALGQLPSDRFERLNAIARTDLARDVPSGGMTVGIIKDQVAVFVRALEQITNTVVVANPKILALNRQKGQVIVGRRDGYLTTTVTETQAIQTVEFLETGTQLVFRPFIGDDGYIRVELHPEDSVGFVNAQGLPSEQTTEVTTNVILRDGETILIGGLFREVTTDARGQVPWLGNLPVLGALFRVNADSTSREEVIILLTVHIVNDSEGYARASQAEAEDIERLRVGIRQGLMWHGRDRLAQSNYHRALKSLDDGDQDLALWYANLSLHNNRRFLPAIRLKERVLRQREWDDDGTAGRSFLYELMSRERGYDLPRFGRPLVPKTDDAVSGDNDGTGR